MEFDLPHKALSLPNPLAHVLDYFVPASFNTIILLASHIETVPHPPLLRIDPLVLLVLIMERVVRVVGAGTKQ
ncbi:hypothetical protein EVAR_15950_1 [Eumeta japonica]|uniref:Uncharacterized protein n=1 Tax=Eumeta variegata TaxID=151549 RepID=A0A4C1UM53_EUMVA|nr:hypothetical protein EVAR_15950_1 [Eumeta japonica]